MEAMTKCPRFKFCNVNICPLDNSAHLRNKLKDEPSCTLTKSIRQKIGTKFGLANRGLSKKELAGFKKWQGKSEAEKSEIKKILAKSGFDKR